MQLRDYESAKFELAEILRTIAAVDVPDASPFVNTIRELFSRLAEDRFNLVVVGRFSRGKTSLMNAILGMERLPTGILPLTSVITRVTYGSSEKVEIEFARGGVPLEIPMERLHDYVTQRGNPGNRLDIRQALVALPAEILRRGFYFIDTPGLGSAISENTRTTEVFLPEADAILLVSGCDSPLTDEEVELIRRLARDQRKLFLIMNKQDPLTTEGRLELVQFIREQLNRLLNSAAPQLFLVSARDALSGKLRGDTALLESSGFPTLESALIEFLTRDRSTVLLLGFAARLRLLLTAIHATALIGVDAFQGLHERIVAFERQLGLNSEDGIFKHRPTSPTGPNQSVRMSACIVCSRIISAWFEFLRHYQLELTVSAEERHHFAQRGGFCERHMGLYASLASQRDLCLALGPLLEQVAIDLSDASKSEHRGDRHTRKAAFSAPACILCEIQQVTEADSFREFSQNYEQHLSERETPLPSVCLPHLKLMATSELYAPQRGACTMVYGIMRQQATAVKRLAEDARRYVLKRDALRHGLATEEEDQAARMAVAFLTGHHKVMPSGGRLLNARSRSKSDHPLPAKKA